MNEGKKAYDVLFLCTGNSARSILAESLLDSMAAGAFPRLQRGQPSSGHVNPLALDILQKNHLPTEGLRSKSWDEFAQPGSPPLDFVFTVCDNAAGEVCPVWPGQPITAHWGIEDPAAVEGDDETKRHAFLNAYTVLRTASSYSSTSPLASPRPPRADTATARHRPPNDDTCERRATRRRRGAEHFRALADPVGRAVHRRRHRARPAFPAPFQALGAHGSGAGQPAGGPADLGDDHPDAAEDRLRRARPGEAALARASA